jgi:hypothetical protein
MLRAVVDTRASRARPASDSRLRTADHRDGIHELPLGTPSAAQHRRLSARRAARVSAAELVW